MKLTKLIRVEIEVPNDYKHTLENSEEHRKAIEELVTILNTMLVSLYGDKKVTLSVGED